MRKSVILCLLLSVPLWAGTLSKTFDKEYDFDQGEVSVSNTNGNITVESWDRDQVQIHAEIEVRSNNRGRAEEFMEKVRIKVERGSGRIEISPDYPHSDDSGLIQALFGNSKPNVKVDFEIKVPKNVELHAKSVNGRVFVSGIDGVADLSTTNGQINAEQMGDAVNAHSTNGGIHVEIERYRSKHDISLHTVNGGIELSLPGDIDADINLSTVNGGIHTDYPVKVEGEFGKKNIHGTINNGGANIELKTVNGGIKLLKY